MLDPHVEFVHFDSTCANPTQIIKQQCEKNAADRSAMPDILLLLDDNFYSVLEGCWITTNAYSADTINGHREAGCLYVHDKDPFKGFGWLWITEPPETRYQ